MCIRDRLYRTQDGWVYIMCNKEKFWPALCDAIGEPDWSTDERFRTFKERLANRELVQELLDERLSERTTADWLETFSGIVPASPVCDLAQALDNPFVAEQNIVQDLELEGHGPIRMVDTPVRTPTPTPQKPASPLGADTDEILKDLGYEKNRLAQLRKAGVI